MGLQFSLSVLVRLSLLEIRLFEIDKQRDNKTNEHANKQTNKQTSPDNRTSLVAAHVIRKTMGGKEKSLVQISL